MRLARALPSLLVVLLVASACKDQQQRVARVEIDPPAVVLLLGPSGGQTVQLRATAFDDRDEVMEGRQVTWRVRGAPAVQVSASGLVTATQVGSTVVQAEIDGRTADRTITVAMVPVETVQLSTNTLSLGVSPLGADTAQLSATLRDSTGAVLVGRTVSWSSSNAMVATVINGAVAAVGGGTATVVATAEGRSAQATVTVTASTQFPPGIDMALTGAQWTQGIQRADGGIPLLRQGRAAVLNVTTLSNAAGAAPVDFVLRLYSAGGTLSRTDTARVTVPNGQSGLTSPTVQFLVPSSALVEGMRWEVIRDPRNVARDANAANDRFPAGTHVAANVVTPPPLKLRFIPIVLSAHGGQAGNVSEANLAEYLSVVRRLMPHGAIEATIGAPFASSVSYGTAPQGGSAAFWTTLLPQLDAARVADPLHFDAHWVGVVAPPAGFNSALNGGWGYIPASGTATGPGTRTFALVNVGWFSNQNQSAELMAHELGHNLGRLHAPCGVSAGTDPAFPNVGGSIGVQAHQTYNWELGLATSAASIPSGSPDVMGYCTGVWISAYNYSAMQAFRGSQAIALQGSSPRVPALLVQGEVADGRVTVRAPIRLATQPDGDAAAGEWVLELLDSDGVVLAEQRFALGRWDHSDSVRPFSTAVSLPAHLESRVERVRVTGPTGTASIRAHDR